MTIGMFLIKSLVEKTACVSQKTKSAEDFAYFMNNGKYFKRIMYHHHQEIINNKVYEMEDQIFSMVEFLNHSTDCIVRSQTFRNFTNTQKKLDKF